jgi:hypothetical protein
VAGLLVPLGAVSYAMTAQRLGMFLVISDMRHPAGSQPPARSELHT